ncbi:MAG: hypothetical protein ACLQJR_13945 [Stellaceae bacterium]
MSHKHSLCQGGALGALLGAALLAPVPAMAQISGSLDTEVEMLRQEVQQLRQQMQSMQNPAATAQPGTAPGALPGPAPLAPTAAASLSPGAFQLGGVRMQFGGFIEAATIFRSRNEVADVGSDYNTGIPFNNSALAHETEFRESARQSRISGLVSGDVNDDTHLAAYVETDFLSAAATSNSRESNSYSLRLRHAYMTLDQDDWGFHFLGGQEWSLLTTNTNGIIPRQEQIPLTIDAQYVEGFNWTRNPQIRVVKNWGHLWAGLSLESPQGVLPPSPGAVPTGVNANNAGDSGGLLNNTTTYTNDIIPDIIAKVAVDPGFGHYELKSIARVFTDDVAGSTNKVWGYGVGGAASMPIVPHFVDLQISGLAGYGIGRYGSGQLPDVAFTRTNSLIAIPEVQGLVGIITHPWAGNDLYLYGGWEHADRAGSPVATAGYGSGTLVNTGCNTFGGTCQAETENLKQVALGTWQDIYKGKFGRFVFGVQGSYIERDAFSGVGGAPSTNEAIAMTSFRYYPF